MADVVERPQTVLVIGRLLAPWCGPCKTLGPMLVDACARQRAVKNGQRIRRRSSSSIAGQLQIQSISDGLCLSGSLLTGFRGPCHNSEDTRRFRRVDQGRWRRSHRRRAFRSVAARLMNMLAEACPDAAGTPLLRSWAKTRTRWCMVHGRATSRWSSLDQAKPSEWRPDGNFQAPELEKQRMHSCTGATGADAGRWQSSGAD